MVEPSPREGSRYYFLLWSRRKPLWERLVWITSLRSCLLPLFDQYLPLPLPAGGGGARVATLAFCARLWSSDQDGPGPPLCSGSDLDLLGMKVLKAAERALASLNFSSTVSTVAPKSWEGETGASSRKALLFLLEVCQIHPQMPLRYHHGCHRPAHSRGSLLGGTEG